jgi:hypothetical protein
MGDFFTNSTYLNQCVCVNGKLLSKTLDQIFEAPSKLEKTNKLGLLLTTHKQTHTHLPKSVLVS